MDANIFYLDFKLTCDHIFLFYYQNISYKFQNLDSTPEPGLDAV